MNAAAHDSMLREIHVEMKGVAQRLRLPFRRHSWKGLAGNWAGVGIGSSIDFQDHRPYLPGDDPRYIDWQAFARTGNYTMKLYREEVSPRVDIILDTSPSMSLTDAKRRRTLELIYFTIESALLCHSSVRIVAVCGNEIEDVPLQHFLSYRWALDSMPEASIAARPAFTRAAVRHGSMRILISDLLFSGAPDEYMRTLRSRRGRAVVLAPYLESESSPLWEGNVELIDCERGTSRRQRVVPEILRKYLDAYRRHFDLWTSQARTYDVGLARVASHPPFLESLQREALRTGAVELWS